MLRSVGIELDLDSRWHTHTHTHHSREAHTSRGYKNAESSVDSSPDHGRTMLARWIAPLHVLA